METNNKKYTKTLPVVVETKLPIETQLELQKATRHTAVYLTQFMQRYNLSPGDVTELVKGEPKNKVLNFFSIIYIFPRDIVDNYLKIY